MIVSFSRKFAFIAVPRTGTHAVREHLRPFLAQTDWEQCRRYKLRSFPVPELAAIGHGHLTARQVQPFLVPGLWERMFSFGYVRDPLDRFVSCCHFLHRGSDRMTADPEGTMARMLDAARDGDKILLRPQYPLLCDDEGTPMVSHVARYENYTAEFDAIAARLGLDATMSRVVNASPRPTSFAVSENVREQVVDIYRRDYELFGYDLP